MTDSYEHITWYKIICYFETIDSQVTQWSKSLSEASLQQSILACSPIHCILMIWSICLLRCWRHRNTVRIQKYTRTHTKDKYDKSTTASWHCFACDCGSTQLPWISSIIQTSRKKRWIHYSIFREVFLHHMPLLSCNKKLVRLVCNAGSSVSWERHLQMGSQVMESHFHQGLFSM